MADLACMHHWLPLGPQTTYAAAENSAGAPAQTSAMLCVVLLITFFCTRRVELQRKTTWEGSRGGTLVFAAYAAAFLNTVSFRERAAKVKEPDFHRCRDTNTGWVRRPLEETRSLQPIRCSPLLRKLCTADVHSTPVMPVSGPRLVEL